MLKTIKIIGLFILRVFQLLIYIVIQLLFIPLAIIGLLIGLYKETYQSKKHQVSFSAGQALQYRWMMHYFGTREDLASVQFTKAFPCESHIALMFVLGPIIWMQKLFGIKTQFNTIVEDGKEVISKAAGKRVLAFDQIIERHINDVDQIVLLGAGFDLIGLRYSSKVPIFEVDLTNTIHMKIKTLQKANIDTTNITYIPVDYETESWTKKLVSNGFNVNLKTLIVWQTVSLYLTEEQVRKTLLDMKQVCKTGSILVQDFYGKEFLSGKISKIAKKQMDPIAKNGEPWDFALEFGTSPLPKIEVFLNSLDISISNYRQFGDQLKIPPYYCIVESKL